MVQEIVDVLATAAARFEESAYPIFPHRDELLLISLIIPQPIRYPWSYNVNSE